MAIAILIQSRCAVKLSFGSVQYVLQQGQVRLQTFRLLTDRGGKHPEQPQVNIIPISLCFVIPKTET